ncbi:MAG: hydroxymethylbilane synthase [Candidatus Melainabacteria bacterium]|nr:hydroxymethylbilane synthase [Candidatus Melainabacteria bacterium]
MRVGTRSSKLALYQTNHVVSLLKELHPQLDCEVVTITTSGDAQRSVPIAEIGTRGVFVKELEEALLQKKVDFVVHSLKDMPVEIPDGLSLVATLSREDSRDVIVSRDNKSLEQIPKNGTIATSSRRRIAQLKKLYPSFKFVDIRGNITTRLRKMDEGECDAMILAAAGLHRLNLKDRIVKYLSIEESTPAAGQGALAIECRIDDTNTFSTLTKLDDLKTRIEISAERAFLGALGGGCSIPIGVSASFDQKNNELTVAGVIASINGKSVHRSSCRKKFDASTSGATELGYEFAKTMQTEEVVLILEELKKEESRVSAP